MVSPKKTEEKYQCPTTGAHFKFIDACQILSKLDRFGGARDIMEDNNSSKQNLQSDRDVGKEGLLLTTNLSSVQQQYKSRNEKLME
jgi:hypothetical protein